LIRFLPQHNKSGRDWYFPNYLPTCFDSRNLSSFSRNQIWWEEFEGMFSNTAVTKRLSRFSNFNILPIALPGLPKKCSDISREIATEAGEVNAVDAFPSNKG
jgi:hypothetical protein